MRRFFFFLLLFFVSFQGYTHRVQLLKLYDTYFQEQPSYFPKDLLISLSYEIHEHQWTDFPLPPHAEQVRVITNLLMPRSEQENMLAGLLRYGVEYQILAKGKEIPLATGRYHFKTGLTLYPDPVTGHLLPSTLLRHRLGIMTDGRVMLLNLNDLRDPHGPLTLRYRAVNEGAALVGSSLIRVYAKSRVAASKVNYRWNRLHVRQKKRLAEGNIYPYDLLENNEITNLMHYRWDPVGPDGIPGRDFEVQPLYLHKELTPLPTSIAPDEPGRQLAPTRFLTLPIAEKGEVVDLTFRRVEADPLSLNQPVTIAMTWHGRFYYQRQAQVFTFTGKEFSKTFAARGGLLAWKSDTPLRVQRFEPTHSGQQAIRPIEPSGKKFFLLDIDSQLSYTLYHFNQEKTPLHLQVRRPIDPPDEAPEVSLKYQFFDSNDQVLAQGEIAVQLNASGYDFLPLAFLWQSLSDPLNRYFLAPIKAQRLVFESNEPLLISLSNRPLKRVKTLRVPEDYFQATPREKKKPGWFSLSPNALDQLKKKGEAVFVRTQHRPPLERQDLMTGDYTWTAFQPQGAWRGGQLLTPKPQGAPQRAEGLAATFFQLLAGKPIMIFPQVWHKQQGRQPRLFFRRQHTSPTQIQLTLDGHIYYQGEVKGRQGLLTLPPLPTKRTAVQLQLQAEKDGLFLLSHLSGQGTVTYAQRFAHYLSGDGLSFEYCKVQAEEMIGFIYFHQLEGKSSRGNQQTRVPLQMVLEKRPSTAPTLGPHTGMTYQQRFYDLRIDEVDTRVMMVHHPRQLSHARRFFFPMNSDLAKGCYILRVIPGHKQKGYLITYRVTSGAEILKGFERKKNSPHQ